MINTIPKIRLGVMIPLVGLALAGGYIVNSCSRPSPSTQPANQSTQVVKTITRDQLKADYDNSPPHLIMAERGSTMDGLTAKTTLGVPREIRREQFKIDNNQWHNSVFDRQVYITHYFTNTATIKD